VPSSKRPGQGPVSGPTKGAGPRKKGITRRVIGSAGRPVAVGPGRRHEDGSPARPRRARPATLKAVSTRRRKSSSKGAKIVRDRKQNAVYERDMRTTPAANRRRTKSGPVRRRKNSGIDLAKFASEVSQNFGRGVARVGRDLDNLIPSRRASGTVPGAMRNAPASRNALRKALGK
jgi:hypothetical protein